MLFQAGTIALQVRTLLFQTGTIPFLRNAMRTERCANALETGTIPFLRNAMRTERCANALQGRTLLFQTGTIAL
ncbi:MAG: hypothetical protein KME42_15170 [Tildeniella nuda ZEHNDER 1965/U140]|nr:hypothetical protein [Tildeniella nuda ZEHNDER 1965/U140]